MDLVKREMTSIDLPKTLLDTYRRMAERARDPGQLVKLTKNGFVDEDGDKVADQFISIIIDSQDYYHKWVNTDEGLVIEKRGIEEFESYEAAQAEGYKLGLKLTFKVLEPVESKDEIFFCYFAEMSAQEYDKHVKRVLSKGRTPNGSYTKIFYQIVPTKKGGPQPKAMFKDMGPLEEEPIDVTPVESSETSPVPDGWQSD
jgi:hypothetical protein